MGAIVSSAVAWLACVGSDPPFDSAAKEADGAAANDSSANDAATSDAATDGGPSNDGSNVLVNADFATSCNPWNVSNASAAEHQPDGDKTPGACRICGDGQNGWVLEQEKTFDRLDAPTSFLTEISIRTLDGADAGGATIDLEVWNSADKQVFSEASGTSRVSTSSWQTISHTFQVPMTDQSAPPWRVKFQLNCRDDSCRSACLIVDDARLAIAK